MPYQTPFSSFPLLVPVSSVGVLKKATPAAEEKSPIAGAVVVEIVAVVPEKSPAINFWSEGVGSESIAGSIVRTNFVAAVRSLAFTV